MYSKLILLTPPLVHCGTLYMALYTLELLLVFFNGDSGSNNTTYFQ